MKCYNIVLYIYNLKNNHGFYIILSIMAIYLICLILFYAKYYLLLKTKVNSIVNDVSNSTIKLNEVVPDKINNNDNNNKSINKNINNIVGEIKIDSKKNMINKGIDKILKKISKKKKRIKKKKFKSKKKINNFNIVVTEIPDNSKREIISQKDNINNNIEYTDLELNELSYEEALKIDNRTFIQYYLSLLRANHLVIFCFFPQNDYNSQIIKIFLFFFFFSVHFTVNALFFNDDTMHKIYKDEGKFNFIYQIPQIIYSAISSGVINTIIKRLSLSSGDIIELKKEKNVDKIKIKEKEVLNKLRNKFILFFILSFILLVTFWYYVTCFCGVYINTKFHLIKDTIISFVLSLLYPFGIYLIPGLFRIPALKAKNKTCMYKLSKILQTL